MLRAFLILVALLLVPCNVRPISAQQVSRFLRTHYRAADGTWVRRPRHLTSHSRPERWTVAPTATCRDGSLSFAHTTQGQCSHHGGIQR